MEEIAMVLLSIIFTLCVIILLTAFIDCIKVDKFMQYATIIESKQYVVQKGYYNEDRWQIKFFLMGKIRTVDTNVSVNDKDYVKLSVTKGKILGWYPIFEVIAVMNLAKVDITDVKKGVYADHLEWWDSLSADNLLKLQGSNDDRLSDDQVIYEYSHEYSKEYSFKKAKERRMNTTLCVIKYKKERDNKDYYKRVYIDNLGVSSLMASAYNMRIPEVFLIIRVKAIESFDSKGNSIG